MVWPMVEELPGHRLGSLPEPNFLRGLVKDGVTPVSPKAALIKVAMAQLMKLSEDLTNRRFDLEKDFGTLCEIYGNFDGHTNDGFCANFSQLMMRSLRRDGEKISEKHE